LMMMKEEEGRKIKTAGIGRCCNDCEKLWAFIYSLKKVKTTSLVQPRALELVLK
jgi:hypothetical protein